MSKSITIPADVSRMEITIHNKTYTYQGGATVTVPDEVAALLAANDANKPGGVRQIRASSFIADVYEGENPIPVYLTADGGLCVDAADLATVALAVIQAADQQEPTE